MLPRLTVHGDDSILQGKRDPRPLTCVALPRYAAPIVMDFNDGIADQVSIGRAQELYERQTLNKRQSDCQTTGICRRTVGRSEKRGTVRPTR